MRMHFSIKMHRVESTSSQFVSSKICVIISIPRRALVVGFLTFFFLHVSRPFSSSFFLLHLQSSEEKSTFLYEMPFMQRFAYTIFTFSFQQSYTSVWFVLSAWLLVYERYVGTRYSSSIMLPRYRCSI